MVAASVNTQHTGHIVQVIGSTYDCEFEEGHLPEIYNAIKIDSEYKGVQIRLTGEVVLIVDVPAIFQRVIGPQHDRLRRSHHTQCGSRFAVDVFHRRKCEVELDGMRGHLADRVARIHI